MPIDTTEPAVIRRSAEELLDGLNPQQSEAVQYSGPALLIGAGAGSGKTRVLTRRIAWALSQWNAWPSQILAITFTNKAAREMKDRLETLIGPAAQRMWVSTFHSACVRMLRRDGEAVGLNRSFTIYDQADSIRLMRTIEQEHGLDPKRVKPRDVLSAISDCKNELKDWRMQLKEYAPDYKPGQPSNLGHLEPGDMLNACLYAEYQRRLDAANSVDFDDLIMRTVQMLQIDPQAAAYYRHKFRYIFVDEYQDTNHAQYVLVRELSGVDTASGAAGTAGTAGAAGVAHAAGAQYMQLSPQPQQAQPNWVTVVGDSDQSIYAFRGADIHNILDFEKDFPNAKTVMLEQNYRSTQTILDAANAVISKNTGRTPKKLWTQEGAGSPIVGYAADDDLQEAQWVAGEIARLVAEDGFTYGDIAIMYRANAQSRRFEEAFINAGIPYQLIGGTRFYERKEVKDSIAYLQCITNPSDDVSMRRILNVPKRGLGERAEALVADYAQTQGITFWQALGNTEQIPGMTTRMANPLHAFRSMMEDLIAYAAEHDANPSDIVAHVLQTSGIIDELRKAKDEQEQGRVENLSQLQSVAAEYEQNTPDSSLAGFLESVALVADSDQLPDEGEQRGSVTLMTLHTSKGLEYPVVFLVGMEEGTFPHSRAMDNVTEMAEERRLAYVGITRARKRLYVTRAGERTQWGKAETMLPSEFLDDIPDKLIDWKRKETSVESGESEFGEFGGFQGFGGFGGSRSFDGFDGSSSRGASRGGSRGRWGARPGGAGSGSGGTSRNWRDGARGERAFGASGDDYGFDSDYPFDDDDYSTFGAASSGGSSDSRSGSRGRSYDGSSNDFGSRGSSYRSSRSSSYGSAGSSYGSGDSGRRGSSHFRYGTPQEGSSYRSGRSGYSNSGSGSSGSYGSGSTRNGKVTTRRVSRQAPDAGSTAASSGSSAPRNSLSISDLHVGDLVSHDKFGLGKIISTEDKGDNSVVTVDFGSDGIKRLTLRMAPMEKL